MFLEVLGYRLTWYKIEADQVVKNYGFENWGTARPIARRGIPGPSGLHCIERNPEISGWKFQHIQETQILRSWKKKSF